MTASKIVAGRDGDQSMPVLAETTSCNARMSALVVEIAGNLSYIPLSKTALFGCEIA